MPRPRSISTHKIIEGALAVLDRDGLEGLTMRSVAAELGMGAMSLYRYVESRHEIERLLVDHIVGQVEVECSGDLMWNERLLLLANRIRLAVAAHPAIVPLLIAHRHDSRSSRPISEALLEALADAGFKGAERVIALRALVSYINGALQAEHLGPLSGQGTNMLAALPVSEYPLLADTAKAARSVTFEAEFEGGLRLLLRGLGSDQASTKQ